MLFRLITAAIAAAVLVVPAAHAGRSGAKHSGPAPPNAVTEWNVVASDAIAVGRPPASSTVLLGLVQAAVYDAGIPDGTAKTNGISLGRAIAGAYLGLRADDGFDSVVLYEQLPVGVGVFGPLVPLPVQPVDVKLKQVRPLTFDDPACFRPDGPDPLNSASYARTSTR